MTRRPTTDLERRRPAVHHGQQKLPRKATMKLHSHRPLQHGRGPRLLRRRHHGDVLRNVRTRGPRKYDPTLRRFTHRVDSLGRQPWIPPPTLDAQGRPEWQVQAGGLPAAIQYKPDAGGSSKPLSCRWSHMVGKCRRLHSQHHRQPSDQTSSGSQSGRHGGRT